MINNNNLNHHLLSGKYIWNFYFRQTSQSSHITRRFLLTLSRLIKETLISHHSSRQTQESLIGSHLCCQRKKISPRQTKHKYPIFNSKQKEKNIQYYANWICLSIFLMLKYFEVYGERTKGLRMKEHLKDGKFNFFFSLSINAEGPSIATLRWPNWEITGLKKFCIQSCFVLDQIRKNHIFGNFHGISESIHYSQLKIQALNWIYLEFTFLQLWRYRNHSSACNALETIKGELIEKKDFLFCLVAQLWILILLAGWGRG